MSNRITLSFIEDIPVVGLSGRLQGDYIDEVEKQLAGNLNSSLNVIFDLKELEFITSLGLRLFLKRRNEVLRKKGEVLIANPTGSVQKILDITGLVNLFLVFDSIDAALNHLHGNSEKT